MGPGGQIKYLNAIEVAALVAIGMRDREAAGPARPLTVSNRSLSAVPAAVCRGDRGARTAALSWNSLRVRCVLVRKICGTAWSACATVRMTCASRHFHL